MPECRSCGAEIEWVQRWTGKAVAIEPDPGPDDPRNFIEVELGTFVAAFKHDCSPLADVKRLMTTIQQMNWGAGHCGELYDWVWKLDDDILEGDYANADWWTRIAP